MAKNLSQSPRAMREGKADPVEIRGRSSEVKIESEPEAPEEKAPWEFMGESATSQKDV